MPREDFEGIISKMKVSLQIQWRIHQEDPKEDPERRNDRIFFISNKHTLVTECFNYFQRIL